MTALKIDFDRDILYEVPVERRPRGGVSIRKDPDTNADVFMYKTDPGIYYGANGVQVSTTMARRAGFDVERLAKERDKRLKMRDFEEKYNAQILGDTRRVVEERRGFKLVDLGDSRFIIEDDEGNNMTRFTHANSIQQGMDWLADFGGPPLTSEGQPVIVPEIKEGIVDDNVHPADGQSGGGVDRRSEPDGRSNRNVRSASNKKASV